MVASSSNGARGPSRFLGDAVLAREPFAAVLEFGEGRASSSWGLLGWSGMAAAFYAGSIVFVVLVGLWSLAPWTKHIQHYIRARLAESYEIDLIENKPVPLPEPEKVIEPAAHPTAEKPTPPPQAPAAAPARAAAVLTARDDEPADFTGFSIVTGQAAEAPGGTTSNQGTSDKPVTAQVVRPDGVPGGTGTAPPPPPAPKGPDRTKGPTSLVQSWSCPFPPEADVAQIDEARVLVEVSVRVDGVAASARPLSDPGNGFGRAATQCAMRQRFNVALDREGTAVAGTWRGYVNFSR